MFADELEPELIIDGQEWNLISAKVVHSQTEQPNYAEIKCVPSLDIGADALPESLPSLRGRSAQLSCKTDLSEARANIAEENGAEFETDSLLFGGRVARIYPVGDKSVDVVLFDPGQSLFEQSSGESPEEDDEQTDENAPGGGGTAVGARQEDTTISQDEESSPSSEGEDQTSIQNKVIDLTNSQFTREVEQENAEGKVTEILAYYAVKYILDELGITDRDISGIIKREGTEYTVGEETYKGGYNVPLQFADPSGTAAELLDQIATLTESTYWFDKGGTFIFGPPDISEYNLRYITETTAGITTPPYQSVKVIGTGVASEEGFTATNQITEEPIVKTAALRPADQSEGGFNVEEDVKEDALRDPVYRYKSADLVTDQQVESAVRDLIQKIGEQQKTGEITVVGFPEVTLDDVLVMPDTPSQPMGGEDYSVTKITHRINNSDGFTTKIQVTAPFVNSLFYREPKDYGEFKPTTILERKGGTPLGLQNQEPLEEDDGFTDSLNDSFTEAVGALGLFPDPSVLQEGDSATEENEESSDPSLDDIGLFPDESVLEEDT